MGLRVRWQRTASLMSVGAYQQAQTLMDQVRHDLGDDLAGMDGPALPVYGSAHLRSAILAARVLLAQPPGHAARYVRAFLSRLADGNCLPGHLDPLADGVNVDEQFAGPAEVFTLPHREPGWCGDASGNARYGKGPYP